MFFSLETSNKMICQLTSLSGFAQCGLKARSSNEILIRHLGKPHQKTDVQGGCLKKKKKKKYELSLRTHSPKVMLYNKI